MKLTPRERQTCLRLLAGDSEKEAARHVGISRHTLHVYVKQLYRRLDVNSRAEFMAAAITDRSLLKELLVANEERSDPQQ